MPITKLSQRISIFDRFSTVCFPSQFKLRERERRLSSANWELERSHPSLRQVIVCLSNRQNESLEKCSRADFIFHYSIDYNAIPFMSFAFHVFFSPQSKKSRFNVCIPVARWSLHKYLTRSQDSFNSQHYSASHNKISRICLSARDSWKHLN